MARDEGIIHPGENIHNRIADTENIMGVGHYCGSFVLDLNLQISMMMQVGQRGLRA